MFKARTSSRWTEIVEINQKSMKSGVELVVVAPLEVVVVVVSVMPVL